MLKLALIGFGTVGQGLAEILLGKADDLRARYGLDTRIVAVCDANKGALYHPDGLDTRTLLAVVQRGDALVSYPDSPGLVRGGSPPPCQDRGLPLFSQGGWDSLTTILKSDADVIVEATWTNLQTGEPAITHIRTAFQAGRHVVTSNKGPVALAYRELKAMADARGLYWGIEGTVMSGTPTLRLGSSALAGCTISELVGILNGTTNFILTRMEAGAAYTDALAEAQRLGYAEADPTADVDGHDALGKLLILAAVVMDHPLSAGEISRQGITHLTLQDIQQARAQGKRWKLIAHLRRTAKGVEGSVGPQMVDISHPLAGVSGATNAITYVTDWLGEVTLVGAGAGRRETGFALLSDLLEINRLCR